MILKLNIEADKVVGRVRGEPPSGCDFRLGNLNSDLIYTAAVGMIHGRHIMGSNFANLAREFRFADLIVS